MMNKQANLPNPTLQIHRRALINCAALLCCLIVGMPAQLAHAHGDGQHNSAEITSANTISRTPNLEGWLVNIYGLQGKYTLSNGSTGHNLADVQQVQHDAQYAYVSTSGIPSYNIGPFNDGNPGVPDERNYRFRITNSPTPNNAAKTATGLGQIGVLVNGVRMNSCLSLLAMRNGDEIVTIEGLSEADTLHPLQRAFWKHDGLQCGFCTPGQICSAVGMLRELEHGVPSAAMTSVAATPSLNAAEVRERMSGNICRCSAYPNIVAAILDSQQGRAG